MACCNDTTISLPGAAPDATQHVNYAKGMVLGVDDFTQEFAYLSGRDNWLAAELAGYGTTSGLKIRLENTDKGVQLRVGKGTAAMPSGKLVCVPGDQCAILDRWLGKSETAKKIDELLTASPPLSPPVATLLSVDVTLCYDDCLTAPVPIPGEPCRSEDDLMAPSRIADSFKLDLRVAPPPQPEEDALRAYAAWLRTITAAAPASPPAGDERTWLAALRAELAPWFDTMNGSPPASPPLPEVALDEYLRGLPPPAFTVGEEQLCDFLHVAFRFWVTELRPEVKNRVCGGAIGMDADCILLSRLDVPIQWIGGSPTGAWQVDGDAAAIAIDESRRPYLTHLRLLQEWLLCGCACASDHTLPPTSPPGMPPPDPSAIARLSTTDAEIRLDAAVTTTDAEITLDAAHHVVICTAAGSHAVNLPTASDNKGRIYVVKNAGAGQKKLACGGEDTIDGQNTRSLATRNAFTLISDGEKTWHIIATVT